MADRSGGRGQASRRGPVGAGLRRNVVQQTVDDAVTGSEGSGSMAALCSGDGGGPLPTGCTATNSNLEKDFLVKIKKEIFFLNQ